MYNVQYSIYDVAPSLGRSVGTQRLELKADFEVEIEHQE